MVRERDLKSLKLRKPPPRTRFIGTRMSEADAAELMRMANAEGVGISAYARMVLEAFVASRRKGK